MRLCSSSSTDERQRQSKVSATAPLVLRLRVWLCNKRKKKIQTWAIYPLHLTPTVTSFQKSTLKDLVSLLFSLFHHRFIYLLLHAGQCGLALESLCSWCYFCLGNMVINNGLELQKELNLLILWSPTTHNPVPFTPPTPPLRCVFLFFLSYTHVHTLTLSPSLFPTAADMTQRSCRNDLCYSISLPLIAHQL